MMLFLAGMLVGAVLSLVWQAWKLGGLELRLELRESRHDMWNTSAQRTDLAEVGVVVLPAVSAPADVLPPSAAVSVPLYDQDAET